jgi:hypothetical protein
MPFRRRIASARTMLRVFQNSRGETPDAGFLADLQFAQQKDLDLSIRIGALLAFDALLITAGINPLTASPGAPLSLDAPSQPAESILVAIGIALLAVSSYLCVRAIMIGEEFSAEGLGEDRQAFERRLLSAYIASIDAQARLIDVAARITVLGGLVTGLVCLWILFDRIF